MIKKYQYKDGDDLFYVQVDLNEVVGMVWSNKRGVGQIMFSSGTVLHVNASCAKRIAKDKAS